MCGYQCLCVLVRVSVCEGVSALVSLCVGVSAFVGVVCGRVSGHVVSVWVFMTVCQCVSM